MVYYFIMIETFKKFFISGSLWFTVCVLIIILAPILITFAALTKDKNVYEKIF